MGLSNKQKAAKERKAKEAAAKKKKEEAAQAKAQAQEAQAQQPQAQAGTAAVSGSGSEALVRSGCSARRCSMHGACCRTRQSDHGGRVFAPLCCSFGARARSLGSRDRELQPVLVILIT